MSFISYYLSYVKLYFTLQITKIKPIEIMMIFSKSLRIKNSNSILKFVIICALYIQTYVWWGNHFSIA